MKVYSIIITEDFIRERIKEAVAAIEADNIIRFPDSEARTEFIEDCVYYEIDKYELYDVDPFGEKINYALVVLDMAVVYGYLL